MQKIIQLPEHIIAKIAAGEVIERPAYAVKELIENAIDSGADFIQIILEESGLGRIQVIDNGTGMTRENLEICFLSHTTSKLLNDDLLGIHTLGFRGEALSSIAAISHMTMQSRTKNAVGGTIISIHNGKLQDIMPIGMPVGTIVIVDNLFNSIPARKKFLKSAQTEFRHTIDVITSAALSYPNIHFTLTHNKKLILDLAKKKDSIERIKTLLGATLFAHFIPLDFSEGYISLRGFIGKPQIASKLHQRQFLFINNRAVTDRLISLAVKEAFGTLLPASNTPVFLLHLTLPYEVVDINVHPRKEQVAFIDRKLIFDAVKLAVTQTLSENNLTFRLAKFKQEASAKTGETLSFAGQLVKQSVTGDSPLVKLKTSSQFVQIANTYFFAEGDGITLYDQHAVHERILYERMRKSFQVEKKKQESSILPKPLTLTLSVSEKQILEEFGEIFEKLGFRIEHFQGTTFVIREIPVIFRGRNIEKILRDMLDDLSQDTGLSDIDLRSQRMLSFLACRAAVKGGDQLSEKEIRDLQRELEKTENNATCPHGRPTRIPITLHELHKMFKRL